MVVGMRCGVAMVLWCASRLSVRARQASLWRCVAGSVGIGDFKLKFSENDEDSEGERSPPITPLTTHTSTQPRHIASRHRPLSNVDAQRTHEYHTGYTRSEHHTP